MSQCRAQNTLPRSSEGRVSRHELYISDPRVVTYVVPAGYQVLIGVGVVGRVETTTESVTRPETRWGNIIERESWGWIVVSCCEAAVLASPRSRGIINKQIDGGAGAGQSTAVPSNSRAAGHPAPPGPHLSTKVCRPQTKLQNRYYRLFFSYLMFKSPGCWLLGRLGLCLSPSLPSAELCTG